MLVIYKSIARRKKNFKSKACDKPLRPSFFSISTINNVFIPPLKKKERYSIGLGKDRFSNDGWLVGWFLIYIPVDDDDQYEIKLRIMIKKRKRKREMFKVK